MPVNSNVSVPEEKIKPPVPADVYNVQIDDIEHEIKPSPFKKTDGTPEEDVNQFKIKFSVTDEGEYNERWITAWVKNSLRASTKSKKPTLVQFLLAVTGEAFSPEQREEINGDFLNGLIGMPLRVTTVVEKSKDGTKEYATITSFLAPKK